VSTVRSARGARRAAARQPHARALPMKFLAAIAGVAIAGVIAVIVIQARSGGGVSVPPRVAPTEGRVLGNEDAPVTIIEYADFQCPICKRAATTLLPELEQQYVATGQVKIEFRMFPFLGQESWDAAQAALAAADQGKFWEYYDALFNAQGRENSGAFQYDRLVAIAQQIGLDVPLFEQTLSSNVHLEDVQHERDAAASAGVTGTPTFFIGDTKIVGVQPLSAYAEAIAAAQQQAGG
jgi:protein-disulfide isomerase